MSWAPRRAVNSVIATLGDITRPLKGHLELEAGSFRDVHECAQGRAIVQPCPLLLLPGLSSVAFTGYFNR